MLALFEKIAQREIPSHIVREDENFFAFLTIEPLVRGHTLVIPKINQGDYIFDLTDQQYTDLMMASKKVAVLLQKKLSPDRVAMGVEGLEVPHVHVHLMPLTDGKGVSDYEKSKPSKEELAKVRMEIVG